MIDINKFLKWMFKWYNYDNENKIIWAFVISVFLLWGLGSYLSGQESGGFSKRDIHKT